MDSKYPVFTGLETMTRVVIVIDVFEFIFVQGTVCVWVQR